MEESLRPDGGGCALAGARPPRSGGKLEDPFGHVWWISTHKEDVPEEEIRKRAAALFSTP